MPTPLVPHQAGPESRPHDSRAKTALARPLVARARLVHPGHGIINEIYYPRIDQACVRDMGLIVTDGASFFSEEKRGAGSRVHWAGRRCAGPPSTGCGMTKDSAVKPANPRILTINGGSSTSSSRSSRPGTRSAGFWRAPSSGSGCRMHLQVKAQNRRTAFRGR